MQLLLGTAPTGWIARCCRKAPPQRPHQTTGLLHHAFTKFAARSASRKGAAAVLTALRRLLARFDSVSGAIMRQSGVRQEELLDPGERRQLSAARHALAR